MSETLAVLGIIGGILSIAGIIAGIVVVARVSYAKAQLELLRSHNNDLTSREQFLDKEVDRLTAEKTAAEAERDIAVNMVTQRADLEKHHQEVMNNHNKLFGVLDLIKTMLEEVLKYVRKGSR